MKSTYDITIILKEIKSITMAVQCDNLSAAKRQAIKWARYPCKIQVFKVKNPEKPVRQWVRKLLATRTLTQGDIDNGVSAKSAKWKNLTSGMTRKKTAKKSKMRKRSRTGSMTII